MIDLSVTLGDADIHLESEPSGNIQIEIGQGTEQGDSKGLGTLLLGNGAKDPPMGSLVLAYDVDLMFGAE